MRQSIKSLVPHNLYVAESLDQGRNVAPLNPGLRDLGENP